MTFEKYARSPAEWLESLYYYLVTKQAWKYEKLNEKILISATFFYQVLSSVTNSHKSTGQFTSWYRIQNLSKLFIQLRLDFFLSEEVNHIQIFIYYGHDLSQHLPQPWLCWPPPWKLKPIISYFPDYYRSEQERLIIWHFKRYLISVWCRAVQFSHKEAALNEHLNDLQMKFGPMRLSSTGMSQTPHATITGMRRSSTEVKGVEESDRCVLFGCGFESKCFANLWIEG